MERHDLAAMDVAELADFLRKLGGTPEAVLSDPDLLAMIQPLLAADFAVNEGYVYGSEPPLDIPLTAFAGVDDAGADVPAMTPWETQTTKEFELHALDGGHFAVFDRAAEVHSVITDSLARHWL
jgi:surfactin synthase thioesterase subunit